MAGHSTRSAMSVFASLPKFSFDVAEGDSSAIPDPRLRDLARYWFARCRDGLVPRRADIDPLEFPPLLPNVILLDRIATPQGDRFRFRSEEHTSELQSLMRISYAVFCLKKQKKTII